MHERNYQHVLYHSQLTLPEMEKKKQQMARIKFKFLLAFQTLNKCPVKLFECHYLPLWFGSQQSSTKKVIAQYITRQSEQLNLYTKNAAATTD